VDSRNSSDSFPLMPRNIPPGALGAAGAPDGTARERSGKSDSFPAGRLSKAL